MSRLLIVDDEERIRVILKKYAEFEGYDTDEAADGMEIITESDRINRARRFSLEMLLSDHLNWTDLQHAGRFLR